MNFISNMRNNAEQHQKAHILLPIFEKTMEFCEDILCTEMNITYLFQKIKKAYVQIDYKSTLKLLVRAKLCA